MQNQIKMQLQRKEAVFFNPVYHKALLFTLAGSLLLAGAGLAGILDSLDKAFHYAFEDAGGKKLIAQFSAQAAAYITKPGRATALTYQTLYVCLAFITLHVYLNHYKKTKIAAGFYGAICAICIVLFLTGKVVSGSDWPSKLREHLTSFLISPFPVILLAATLKTTRQVKIYR